MSKTKAWIKACRLRTLPLSLSCVLMGTFLAVLNGSFSITVFFLAMGTTTFLQVLSNLANDYGDAKKGTDNQDRLGPARAVQSGIISLQEMKVGIIVTSVLSFLSGIGLIYVSLGHLNISYTLFFLLLGLGAIAAAIKYTMGKKPYGYAGLGDVFVFLFFGLIGVIGNYYLQTTSFQTFAIAPAITIGLLSAAVLNMNNMRDHINDKACNKNTLVVMIGLQNARIYHTLLIIGAFVSMASFFILYNIPSFFLTCFIPLPVFVVNIVKVWTVKNEKELDPELKKIALGTFALTLLFGAGLFWQVSL